MERKMIYLDDAIDAVKRNTFRLTFAEEQNCEGHVAWSAEAVYSDVMEGELLELPSAQPEDVIHITGSRKFVSEFDFDEDEPEQDCESCVFAPFKQFQPERKKGEWIYGEHDIAMCDGYRCDQCGFFVPWDYKHKFIDFIKDYHWCPSCGADMRGEEK